MRSPGEPVCYRRQFNCPTGLSSETQLFLMFQGCEHLESVKLNQAPLPLEDLDHRLRRAQVAHLLPGANRLELQLCASEGKEPRLSGQVWLEIVEPS